MKEKRNPILRPIMFEVPLDEIQAYRAAARIRGIGVVRWLRDLANDDIKRLIADGAMQGGGGGHDE